jgi:hypothetical protein
MKITIRQDLVEELSSSEEIYFALCKKLSTFPDLESVVAALLPKERSMQRIFDTRAEQEPRRSSILQVVTHILIIASILLHQATEHRRIQRRRINKNTAFHDAHSKWTPSNKIMPRRYPSYSRRAEGMRFSDAPRYYQVSASASSGNVSHEIGLVLQESIP